MVASGESREQVREPFGGSVGAMRRGEGVVDEDVAIFGELFGEGRIVLLLALVEARVFQKQDVAVGELGHGCRGERADAVGGEGDRPADDLGDGIGDRRQREFGLRPTFGPAEMRKQDDFRFLAGKLQHGRRDALDTGRVGHLAVGDRHVEVDTDQHPFALDVADPIERLESGHRPLLLVARNHLKPADLSAEPLRCKRAK